MIEDKYVDLYARNSGLRDKLVAERDVVLTYALRGLFDTGVTKHLDETAGVLQPSRVRSLRRTVA